MFKKLFLSNNNYILDDFCVVFIIDLITKATAVNILLKNMILLIHACLEVGVS